MTTVRVAVAGASGYTGVELIRLLAQHPHVELTTVTSEKSAGLPVASVFPHLSHAVPLTFEALEPDALAERADVIFLALPHTKSMEPVANCMRSKAKIIDLSADYRLHDAHVYERWYQTVHTHAELLKKVGVRSAGVASIRYCQVSARCVTRLLSNGGHSSAGAPRRPRLD